MYRCSITGKTSKVYEKLNRITVETRARTYTHRDTESDEEWTSIGSEIVKEIDASDEGVALWATWTDEQRKLFVSQL